MNNMQTILTATLKNLRHATEEWRDLDFAVYRQERRTKAGKAEFDRLYMLKLEARDRMMAAEEAADALLKTLNPVEAA